MMDANTFADTLAFFMEEIEGESFDTDFEVADVRSFESAGLLTTNDGIVVKMSDGSEFQLTVVKSR